MRRGHMQWMRPWRRVRPGAGKTCDGVCPSQSSWWTRGGMAMAGGKVVGEKVEAAESGERRRRRRRRRCSGRTGRPCAAPSIRAGGRAGARAGVGPPRGDACNPSAAPELVGVQQHGDSVRHSRARARPAGTAVWWAGGPPVGVRWLCGGAGAGPRGEGTGAVCGGRRGRARKEPCGGCDAPSCRPRRGTCDTRRVRPAGARAV